jgi:hypothetical protein
LLASHEAMGSAPLVPFVSFVTWRLHSAVHSGTQRALIARFMSGANTCTHTNAHARTHERCLSLPLSPPCRCHAHAHTCGPPWRWHAHLLVLSHSCTASSLPAWGGGPTDRPEQPYHQPLSRRLAPPALRGEMRLAPALAPASRRVPTREWTHG